MNLLNLTILILTILILMILIPINNEFFSLPSYTKSYVCILLDTNKSLIIIYYWCQMK